MNKGFTLIELMIVVAIIAIIAAIAIPNLMESKKAANEGNASTACKTYCTAQATYQANNYSFVTGNGGDGTQGTVKCFSPSWQNLGGTTAHKNSAGTLVALIPPVFAAADALTTAWNGYFFNDMVVAAVKYQHGLCANPATYGNTGVNTYIVNEQAIVYMKDQGSSTAVTAFPADPAASGWTTP